MTSKTKKAVSKKGPVAPTKVFGELVYTREVIFEYVPFGKTWAAVKEITTNSYAHSGYKYGKGVPVEERHGLELPSDPPETETREFVLPIKGIENALKAWKSPYNQNTSAIWIDTQFLDMLRLTPVHLHDSLYDTIAVALADPINRTCRNDIFTVVTQDELPSNNIVRIDPDWMSATYLDGQPLPQAVSFYLSDKHYNLKKALQILSERSDVIIWNDGWQCGSYKPAMPVKTAVVYDYDRENGTLKFDWLPTVKDFNQVMKNACHRQSDPPWQVAEIETIVLSSDIFGLSHAAKNTKVAKAHFEEQSNLFT